MRYTFISAFEWKIRNLSDETNSHPTHDDHAEVSDLYHIPIILQAVVTVWGRILYPGNPVDPFDTEPSI